MGKNSINRSRNGKPKKAIPTYTIGTREEQRFASDSKEDTISYLIALCDEHCRTKGIPVDAPVAIDVRDMKCPELPSQPKVSGFFFEDSPEIFIVGMSAQEVMEGLLSQTEVASSLAAINRWTH